MPDHNAGRPTFGSSNSGNINGFLDRFEDLKRL